MVVFIVGMLDVGEEMYGWWGEWIVFWEFEFGGEDVVFKRGVFWILDEVFLVEEVVFGDGVGCDVVWRVVG